MSNKNSGLIYLSGGMEKSADLGAQWRANCSKELIKRNFLPLDITALDVAYTKAHGVVYMSKDSKNYLQYKSNIRHQFIYTDLRLIIDNSDAVIAYYDESFKNGAGSFAECQISYDHQKPLFIVSTFSEDNVPSWLKALSTKLFFSFSELYTYLDSLPQGILKVDKYGNHHSNNHYLCSLCGNVFEKSKHHFVSKVSPLYCIDCVDLVQKTREQNVDRYEFCLQYFNLKQE